MQHYYVSELREFTLRNKMLAMSSGSAKNVRGTGA